MSGCDTNIASHNLRYRPSVCLPIIICNIFIFLLMPLHMPSTPAGIIPICDSQIFHYFKIVVPTIFLKVETNKTCRCTLGTAYSPNFLKWCREVPLSNKDAIGFVDRLSLCQVSNSNASVSYTHLDVYKRQVLFLNTTISQLWLHNQLFTVSHSIAYPYDSVESLHSCLLYTSRCV